MKISLAKKKYKKYWKKMYPHLVGVTAIMADGEIDFYESDLQHAYDMATKGKSDIVWD